MHVTEKSVGRVDLLVYVIHLILYMGVNIGLAGLLMATVLYSLIAIEVQIIQLYLINLELILLMHFINDCSLSDFRNKYYFVYKFVDSII